MSFRRACEVSYAASAALDEGCERLLTALSHEGVGKMGVSAGVGEAAAALLAYLDLARWGEGARANSDADVSWAPGASLADRAEAALSGLVRALAIAAHGVGGVGGSGVSGGFGGVLARSTRLRAMVDAARHEVDSRAETRRAESERVPTTMSISASPVRSAA